MSSKQGVAIIAYNNSQLDYLQFASIAAGYAKLNMKNIEVALITDTGTVSWMEQSMTEDMQSLFFDYVIAHEIDHDPNPRKHYDSPWTEFAAQFSNKNKNDIFNLTPFDKTLLIDSDYIIQNNFYNYLFESDVSLGMHRTARYLDFTPPYLNEQQLNEAGIHHWWSTAVYFDKSDESKIFFDMWAHVKENWEYYHLLYQFPPALFRTDFCVSIAAHMLNGFNSNNLVHDFKNIPLVNMDQKDDLIRVKNINDWTFLAHNRQEQWKNLLVRTENENLHIMNKRALARHAPGILKELAHSLKVLNGDEEYE